MSDLSVRHPNNSDFPSLQNQIVKHYQQNRGSHNNDQRSSQHSELDNRAHLLLDTPQLNNWGEGSRGVSSNLGLTSVLGNAQAVLQSQGQSLPENEEEILKFLDSAVLEE